MTKKVTHFCEVWLWTKIKYILIATQKGCSAPQKPIAIDQHRVTLSEGMRRAEVSFGPQKDYYKNAEKFLNERDNLKKDKMRHAITLNRIENNVKRLGSMIHNVDPLQVDDVAIPDDNPVKEFERKHEKADRIMRLRLMSSHNSIPEEAMERQRPLDRDAIAKCMEKLDAAVDPAIHEKWDLKVRTPFQKHASRQNLPKDAKEALEKSAQRCVTSTICA